MRRNSTVSKLTVSGALIALGVVGSSFYIPVLGAKCFPLQHFINVIAAVLLGPGYALGTAFSISLLRNISGLGTVLAFPGSMVGAALAGLVYQRTASHRWASLGEAIGTGLIGSLLAVPIASLVLDKTIAIFGLVLPFSLSSVVGSIIAFGLLEKTPLQDWIKQRTT